jgi:hypothetical protein
MRAAVNRSDDPATVRDAVRRFLDGLVERQPAAMAAA